MDNRRFVLFLCGNNEAVYIVAGAVIAFITGQIDHRLYLCAAQPHPHHSAHHAAAAGLIQLIRLLQRLRFYIITDRQHDSSPFPIRHLPDIPQFALNVCRDIRRIPYQLYFLSSHCKTGRMKVQLHFLSFGHFT